MDNKIRIGVLGAGHLGKIHLQLLREIPAFELVGFFETDLSIREKVSAELGIRAWDDRDQLIDACDAMDIVTPTKAHFECAKAALRKFRHIFLEKPLTHTFEEARELMGLVREAKVKAQVSHPERFNPAYLAVKERDLAPLFMDSHQLNVWNPEREVSVVLDLMLEDIDIVLSMIRSPLKKISATGVSVVSDSPDIVNARIEFHNGAVANLTASRISPKAVHKFRIYQRGHSLTLDFLDKKVDSFPANENIDRNGNAALGELMLQGALAAKATTNFSADANVAGAVKQQLQEFAKAILNDTPVAVTLEEASAALDVAYQILDKINAMIVA
jgi:predicted dehydrogenase